MAFLKKNWVSVIFLSLMTAYVGVSMWKQQCPTCMAVSWMTTPESNSANSDVVALRSQPWEVEMLDGSMATSSNMKGKVCVIVYFATWCDPCKKEVPTLKALNAHFDDSEVSIVAISMDQPGKELGPFIRHYDIDYKVGRNSPSLDSTFGPIKYLPTIVIVDKNGNLAHRHTGAVSEDVLKMQIKTLLM